MSGSMTTFLTSPKQASDIYSQTYGFPKHRHTFLVRFHRKGVSAATTSLTYAAKSFDRPAFQPVAEELNQYNKKRSIYTGYKKTPVKCSFYDDGKSSALQMWAEYSKYYFGDFGTLTSGNDFSDDITSGVWMDNAKSGFGFTARNGSGATGTSARGSQFFFSTIEILHFHNKVYDLYTLINPKIVSFAPDELDYEQSVIAMINCEFVYEAMTFQPNYGGGATSAATAALAQEFSSGSFNGRAPDGLATESNATTGTTPGAGSLLSQFSQAFSGAGGGASALLQQAFGGLQGLSPTSLGNAFFGSAATGALGALGNFVFGAANNAVGGASSNVSSVLSALASSNPALAATLGLGSNTGNPLSTPGPLGVTQAALTGVSSQLTGILASLNAGSSGYGGALISQLAQGILAGAQLGGSQVSNPNGLTLTPQALSVLNSQLAGSTQYGINTSSLGASTTPTNTAASQAISTSLGTTAPATTQQSDTDLPIPPIPPAQTPTSPIQPYVNSGGTSTAASNQLQPLPPSQSLPIPVPPIPPAPIDATDTSAADAAAQAAAAAASALPTPPPPPPSPPTPDPGSYTDPDTGLYIDPGTG